jgi:GR25 family glycosyltransferase involved in LPS biosynthesis
MKWVDKIYIISLERHQRRKNQIFADLHSAGFDVSKVEWIHAVDGSKLDVSKSINDGLISDTFIDPQGVLTKSVYGCALSHQKAYKSFLETSDNVKTALILEDDASVTHTLLRMCLTKDIAYKKLIEEKDIFDWDVIVMGGQYKTIEHLDTHSFVLKEMKRYPVSYAAHSYVINKDGAKKLIESNSPIQFAADVNLHVSDVKLYCTPISYFSQKIGSMDKWTLVQLQTKFKYDVLYTQENWETDEMISSTTYGDYGSHITDDDVFISVGITKEMGDNIDTIDFKSFKAPNGDEINSWVNIHLKK